MSNRTLAIIKPDAVDNGYTGKIIDRIISAGFKIRAVQLMHLSREQAESFYAVHGSDSDKTAQKEIAFFYSTDQILHY